MHLTQTEFYAYKQEVTVKNCSICQQAIHLTQSDKFICTKGLRFPYCLGNKKKGFKEKNEQ